jgi:hypothetical protein
MRGDDQKQTSMFSYLTLAQRIPADPPARQTRVLVDRALERLDWFCRLTIVAHNLVCMLRLIPLESLAR